MHRTVIRRLAAVDGNSHPVPATAVGLDINDTVYHLAHDYPGGVPALAQRMGMSANTLAHKVSLTQLGHHPSPGELVKMQAIAGDARPLQAMADRMGYMLMPLPVTGAMDDQFAQRLAASVREFGEFVAEVSKDLADNRVNDNELRTIQRELVEMIASAQALYAYAAGCNAASKPAAPSGPSLQAVAR